MTFETTLVAPINHTFLTLAHTPNIPRTMSPPHSPGPISYLLSSPHCARNRRSLSPFPFDGPSPPALLPMYHSTSRPPASGFPLLRSSPVSLALPLLCLRRRTPSVCSPWARAHACAHALFSGGATESVLSARSLFCVFDVAHFARPPVYISVWPPLLSVRRLSTPICDVSPCSRLHALASSAE